MPRQLRLSAQKALDLFRDIQSDITDSGEENIDENENQIQDILSETDESSDESLSESNHPDEDFTGKDETHWVKINQSYQAGRRISQNSFVAKPGVKPFAKRQIDSPLSAWHHLVRNNMLEEILKFTNEKICSVEGELYEKLCMNQLKAFLGLTYMRGALGWRKTSVPELWSNEFGSEYFRDTMSRNNYIRIMKFIRI